MGLLVLDPEADALAVDELLEDPESCRCAHTAGDHTPVGCRAGDCLCAATWDGLAGEDQDGEDPELDVARVVASLMEAPYDHDEGSGAPHGHDQAEGACHAAVGSR